MIFSNILLITNKYDNIAKANRIKFSSLITKLFNDIIEQIFFSYFQSNTFRVTI